MEAHALTRKSSRVSAFLLLSSPLVFGLSEFVSASIPRSYRDQFGIIFAEEAISCSMDSYMAPYSSYIS